MTDTTNPTCRVEVLSQVMNRGLDNLRTRVGERLALER